ncbi:MAG: NAD(P)/FAD-dependent oxidoreductase [Candidatus Omnitrophota bacterium]
MDKVEITIIGAGVIGLAVAVELSKVYADIIVIEKNSSFGQEISSRNSEVIHAGIYYPKNSLKTKTCIEGKQMLYEYCRKNNISHKRIEKLIVAIDDSEVQDLEALLRNGLDNGVDDLRLLSRSDIKRLEPSINAESAIISPSTGILDSHGLMKTLVSEFQGRNGTVAYNTELLAVDKIKGGFKVTVDDKMEGAFSYSTRFFINSAGLNSGEIAKKAGIETSEYKLKYCKGDYFRVHNNKARFINRLIYPVPKEGRAGLGIHATLDLANGLRLGPDDEYVDKINYDVNESKGKVFYESVRKFLPFINLEDVGPDMAGIRPKLQGPGEDFRDFLIKGESENGFPGIINLIGIESPGLTSSLSIARMVRKMVEGIS